MSKELMENLLIEFDEMCFEPTTLCDNQKEVDSFRNRLKQVLDYLKAIDNVKPSEALEDLKELHELAYGSKETSWKIDEIRMSSHIKQALLKSQEQEKVLEIIKEKRVDCKSLIECSCVDEYNDIWFDIGLTQEEFDLLKRYFNESD